ncbi:MAG: general secretion pathway protein A [Desulfobacteraceae bacterium Eth-SRB2]|nr:MAG: general secretion pathway protein A [Desulfobacteraceae bacterium Eth-SRB2]
MYLAHYNLKEKPFQISTDPKFIWLGENHREGISVLEYGVLDNKGFLLITGDVGTGKSTLINVLLERLGNETLVATVNNPVLEQLDFFNMIANEFNSNIKFNSKAAFLTYFHGYLNDCYLKNKKVILIIDEAHRLNQELLEQIRLLSNIERPDTKLLNIFFVGQNEFIDLISKTENRALKQRITINYHLDPLKETEVGDYIFHRLNVAGHKKNIFNENAIAEIFSFSKGYPRLINIICDHALLTGYTKEVKIIDEMIIKECADELLLPTERSDHYNKNLETRGKKLSEFIKEESIKSSGRKFKYIATSVLSLIILGFLFYLGNLSRHTSNIKKYFISDLSEQAKLTSTNIPQIAIVKQKTNPAVQDSGNSQDTPLPLTDPASKNYDEYKQEEKDITAPQKAEKIHNLISTKDLNQEEQPDKMLKPRNALNLEFIPAPKKIINFGYDSKDLSDKALEILEQTTELIIQHPNTEVIINGYTDSVGDDSYNKDLSKSRANIVKNFFVGRGISPSRIKTFGLGQKNPIGSNKTLEGRTLNRRVEIKLNTIKE